MNAKIFSEESGCEMRDESSEARSKRGERKKQGNGREIVKKGVKEKYRGREWANEYGKHID